MGMAKVVVCNAIPAFTEIIKNGENGFVANNEEGFAATAIQLLQDTELLDAIGQRARKTVVKHFDVNTMINETIKYYKEIHGE